MAALLKSEAVLDMVFATTESVCMRQQDNEWPVPNDGSAPGEGFYPMVVFSREAWEDMGEPQTVTVSIEPGDTLNV